MDNTFKTDEKLYRAVYPPELASMYWKSDGSVSSAAFADPKGLSVTRGFYRSDQIVVDDMLTHFQGSIVSVYVKNCKDIGTVVIYKPSRSNKYHSEIHGSDKNPLLSKQQRRYLAKHCRILS